MDDDRTREQSRQPCSRARCGAASTASRNGDDAGRLHRQFPARPARCDRPPPTGVHRRNVVRDRSTDSGHRFVIRVPTRVLGRRMLNRVWHASTPECHVTRAPAQGGACVAYRRPALSRPTRAVSSTCAQRAAVRAGSSRTVVHGTPDHGAASMTDVVLPERDNRYAPKCWDSHHRVVRRGDSTDPPSIIRSARRHTRRGTGATLATDRSADVSFRVARDLPGPQPVGHGSRATPAVAARAHTGVVAGAVVDGDASRACPVSRRFPARHASVPSAVRGARDAVPGPRRPRARSETQRRGPRTRPGTGGRLSRRRRAACRAGGAAAGTRRRPPVRR